MAEEGGGKDARPARNGPLHQIEVDDFRRDRLLAALALILGAAFCLGLPFALQAGAEFFLPLTAAIVVSIALVPLLEWLERRGVPSGADPEASIAISALIRAEPRSAMRITRSHVSSSFSQALTTAAGSEPKPPEASPPTGMIATSFAISCANSATACAALSE